MKYFYKNMDLSLLSIGTCFAASYAGHCSFLYLDIKWVYYYFGAIDGGGAIEKEAVES